MRVVSFNVNGIRSRLDQLAAVIDRHQPAVIGLQETKVEDALFPQDTIRDLGYGACFHGQKGHYGVALLYRDAIVECHTGLPSDGEDAQRRLAAITLETADGPLYIYNGYFPQGENRSHPTKFPNKQDFYRRLLDHLNTRHTPSDNIIVMGDMNVAPRDIDIGIGEDNRKRWLREGKCCFLPEEREWLQALQSWGLEDTFDASQPNPGEFRYSWFDYRSKGFEREPKRGLRIDLILASRPLREKQRDAGVDQVARGMERPSDHCPVWADFDIRL